MENNWVKIFATQDAIQAQLVSDHLQNHGISSVILNKKDSSYVVLGEVEVHVQRDNALRSIHILKDFLNA